MRSFAILAAIYAATVGTTSALVDASERTWVDVDATGHDISGCSPNGCVPENTRDGDLSDNSRWSCRGEDLSDDDEECCIMYYFEEPQDLVEMRIAFHQGNEKTRTLDVFDNGRHSTIVSPGSTTTYETFNLYTSETSELKLCRNDPRWNSDDWLSIIEVKLMVE